MPITREAFEGTVGCASQDPRDMVKAKLLEAQFLSGFTFPTGRVLAHQCHEMQGTESATLATSLT